jgi:hypothetical protein
MSVVVCSAAALVLLVALAFVLLFHRLATTAKNGSIDSEWCRDFSIDRYRPMERLLFQGDWAFLASQPGFCTSIARRLKSQRRRLLRQYLRGLGRDFEKLYRAAKLLLLHSPEDRPDLAMVLLKQRWIFRCNVAALHCRLILQPIGLPEVDLGGFLEALGSMRDQVGRLAAGLQTSASVRVGVPASSL